MAHVPHLFVPGPWTGETIDVTPEQRKHVSNVLRREPGSPVSYTDGSGLLGEGNWTGVGIERGAETSTPEPVAALTLAVAPPDSKERVRWMVEKSTELGVLRIRWLRTRFGQGRLPRPEKAEAWMQGALEQSRGSRVTIIDSGWSELADLGEYVAAERTGDSFRPSGSVTVAIGPEGGWAPSEIPPATPIVSLGDAVLRSETAAIAAAAIFGSQVAGS